MNKFLRIKTFQRFVCLSLIGALMAGPSFGVWPSVAMRERVGSELRCGALRTDAVPAHLVAAFGRFVYRDWKVPRLFSALARFHHEDQGGDVAESALLLGAAAAGFILAVWFVPGVDWGSILAGSGRAAAKLSWTTKAMILLGGLSLASAVNGPLSGKRPLRPGEWAPVMRRAIRMLAEKNIQPGQDLVTTFQEADAIIERNLGEETLTERRDIWHWRRLQLLLTGELLRALAAGATEQGGLYRIQHVDGGDIQVFEVLYRSSQGWVRAKLSFNLGDKPPRLRISLEFLGTNAHVFEHLRLGCDPLTDWEHAWPHLDIGLETREELAWAYHIFLFPPPASNLAGPAADEDIKQIQARFREAIKPLIPILKEIPRMPRGFMRTLAPVPAPAPAAALPPKPPQAPSTVPEKERKPGPKPVTSADRRELPFLRALMDGESEDLVRSLEKLPGVRRGTLAHAREGLNQIFRTEGLTGEIIRELIPNLDLPRASVTAFIRAVEEFRRRWQRAEERKARPPVTVEQTAEAPAAAIILHQPKHPDDLDSWMAVFRDASASLRKPLVALHFRAGSGESTLQMCRTKSVPWREHVGSPGHPGSEEANFHRLIDGLMKWARLVRGSKNIQKLAFGGSQVTAQMPPYVQVINRIEIMALGRGLEFQFLPDTYPLWQARATEEILGLEAGECFLRGDLPGYFERRNSQRDARRQAEDLQAQYLSERIARTLKSGRNTIIITSERSDKALTLLRQEGYRVEEHTGDAVWSQTHADRLLQEVMSEPSSTEARDLAYLRAAVSDLYEKSWVSGPTEELREKARWLTQWWEKADLEELSHRLVGLPSAETSLEVSRATLELLLRRTGLTREAAREAPRRGGDDEAVARLGYFLASFEIPSAPADPLRPLVDWLMEDQREFNTPWLTSNEQSFLARRRQSQPDMATRSETRPEDRHTGLDGAA